MSLVLLIGATLGGFVVRVCARKFLYYYWQGFFGQKKKRHIFQLTKTTVLRVVFGMKHP